MKIKCLLKYFGINRRMQDKASSNLLVFVQILGLFCCAMKSVVLGYSDEAFSLSRLPGRGLFDTFISHYVLVIILGVH